MRNDQKKTAFVCKQLWRKNKSGTSNFYIRLFCITEVTYIRSFQEPNILTGATGSKDQGAGHLFVDRYF